MQRYEARGTRRKVSYITTESDRPLTTVLPPGPGPGSLKASWTTSFLISVFFNTVWSCCRIRNGMHTCLFFRRRPQQRRMPHLSAATRLCLTGPSAKISPDMNTFPSASNAALNAVSCCWISGQHWCLQRKKSLLTGLKQVAGSSVLCSLFLHEIIK